MFDRGTGYAYKYNPKTDELKDITPTEGSGSNAKKLNVGYGAVTSDKNDANKLVATTCAQWYSQSWTADAWERDAIAWGDRFFKSEDGGETWTFNTLLSTFPLLIAIITVTSSPQDKK